MILFKTNVSVECRLDMRTSADTGLVSERVKRLH